MKQDEKIARLRLIRSNNIGPVTSFLLISRYGSAIEAIRALPELTKRSRNRAKLAPLKSAEKEMRDVEIWVVRSSSVVKKAIRPPLPLMMMRLLLSQFSVTHHCCKAACGDRRFTQCVGQCLQFCQPSCR